MRKTRKNRHAQILYVDRSGTIDKDLPDTTYTQDLSKAERQWMELISYMIANNIVLEQMPAKFILKYQMVCANITALGGSWNVNIPGPAGTIPFFCFLSLVSWLEGYPPSLVFLEKLRACFEQPRTCNTHTHPGTLLHCSNCGHYLPRHTT